MTRMLGYARITSLDRSRLALQHDTLASAGCERIFTDTTPAAGAPQPQLETVLAALEPTDLLVVWSLDRLAHSLTHLLGTATRITDNGAGLWSITEDIDTSDPDTGTHVLEIFAALSTCQHAIRREHALIGLAVARNRGRVGGRPRALTPVTVAQARTMKADGATMTAIAQALGVGRSTVYRYLT
ncbi:recombinase family protein [Rhodococcus sp. NPDC059968]|uniref:recombinase family protein n=1 Tax=Rhodococcus sp. NPDC059968 TaxID=3347017 RepID=UPI00367006B2